MLDVFTFVFEPSKLNIYIDHRQQNMKRTASTDKEGYLDINVEESDPFKSMDLVNYHYPATNINEQPSITHKIQNHSTILTHNQSTLAASQPGEKTTVVR